MWLVRFVFWALVILVGGSVGLLLAMCFPAVGTPVTNWALETWAPEGSRVEQAHTDFPQINRLITDGLTVPERTETRNAEFTLNPFGWLPGAVYVSKATASDGTFHLGRANEQDAPDNRAISLSQYVDGFELTNISLIFDGADDRRLEVSSASGSLSAGVIELEAEGGGVTLSFDGEGDASSLSTIAGTLSAEGENLDDLAYILGFASPDTPPFDLELSLSYGDLILSITGIEGMVGDSDLSGTLSIDLNPETPRLNADLRSASLDFDDLGVLFGLPTGTGENETASEAQQSASDAYRQSDRAIPDVRIDFDRLDAVDGRVQYRADRISDAPFDVRRLVSDVTIENRIVRAETFEAELTQGIVRAFATLDGSQTPAHTDIEGNIQGVSFESLSLGAFARGRVDGTFELSLDGDGFREAAASADGSTAIWSRDGEVRSFALEAADLDIGEALALMADGSDSGPDASYMPLRCAVARIEFDNGAGQFAPVVFDTADSLVALNGGVNLGDETMDFEVRVDAKDASWGGLLGNLSVGGTFRDPSISPITAEAILQAGAAALLGSVSGGLAALPFIEPGSGTDAPCGALLARAEG